MKKFSIKKENKDYVEFNNGLFYMVEEGYLTFNKKNIENSIAENHDCQIYREVIPQLELPLTHKCNLNCVYCSFRDRMKDRTDLDMPWDIMEKSLVLFKNYLEKEHIQYARIDFGVTGEPFIRKDIFERVFLCIESVFKDSNVKKIWAGPHISNATYPVINDLVSDFCASQDVSCDGPKDIHDKMRVYPNGKGTFDDFIKSLSKIKDSEPKFGVSAVLTSENPDFACIFNYLHDNLKFSTIYMKPANLKHKVSYSLNEKNLEIYKNSYTLILDSIMIQEPNKILDSLLSFSKEDFFMRFFYRIKNRSKQFFRCGCGKSGIYVDTNGELYPCAHFIGMNEYSIGNLSTGINEEKRNDYLNLSVSNRKSCNLCWARYLCGGGCHYQSVLANDSIKKPDETKCELVKHLIKEAIRLYYFLYTEHPEILNALPSTYFLHNEELNTTFLSTYIPQSKFYLTEKASYIPLISERKLKGTLNDKIPQIYFSLKRENSEVVVIIKSDQIIDFDIDFWVCNLDEYEFLKGDLYNLNSYLYADVFRVSKEMLIMKLDRNCDKVQRIPYSDPKWIPCNELKIKYCDNSAEIHFDLKKLYDNSFAKLGINFTCKFSEGYVSLVSNEPYCLLDSIENGYYTLKTNDFNEEIIIQDSFSKENSMFPIDRWQGMKPNVC